MFCISTTVNRLFLGLLNNMQHFATFCHKLNISLQAAVSLDRKMLHSGELIISDVWYKVIKISCFSCSLAYNLPLTTIFLERILGIVMLYMHKYFKYITIHHQCSLVYSVSVLHQLICEFSIHYQVVFCILSNYHRSIQFLKVVILKKHNIDQHISQ